MTTVYLHVGAHKTASSSIQHGLALLTEQLQSLGILFPLLPGPDLVPGTNHSALLYSLFGDKPEQYHINKAAGLQTQKEVAILNQRYLQFLEDALAKNSFGTIIFSGEDMILLSDRGINNLQSFLRARLGRQCVIKIVCYIRAPNDWLASFIQQWVRGGGVLEELLRKDFPDLRQRIEPFLLNFGLANVFIRRYEDAITHKAGPLGDLLALVSDEIDTSAVSNHVINKGLCAEAVHLVSALNKLERSRNPGNDDGAARAYLEPFFQIHGARFILPQSVQKQAWDSACPSLEWIESVFGIETYPRLEYRQQVDAMWGEDAIASIASLILHGKQGEK